jgi:hypothetical protein
MTQSNVPTTDKPQTTNTMDANTLIRFCGHDVDWWDSAMLVALSFAAIAAVAVVVATTGVIISQKQQSAADQDALEKYKAISGVRTATLEKEAADARSETERIKQVVDWRILTVETAEELKNVLKINPGHVNLRYTDGDPESLFFAIQFSKVLVDANWKYAPGSEKTNAIIFGISLPDPSSPEMEVLRAAFSAAKIPFSTQPPPKYRIVCWG